MQLNEIYEAKDSSRIYEIIFDNEGTWIKEWNSIVEIYTVTTSYCKINTIHIVDHITIYLK